MRVKFEADIKWISHEAGGRIHPPLLGTRYCPLIKIRSCKREDWSIVFICPDFKKNSKITFSFLVDSAPIEHIITMKSYDLYEGNKKVAMVYVEKKIVES